MRFAFLVMALVGLAGLGALDVASGNLRAGIASLLLATANGLLLTQG